MSYLEELRRRETMRQQGEKNSHERQNTNLQNHQNPEKEGFVGFDGSLSGTHGEISSGQRVAAANSPQGKNEPRLSSHSMTASEERLIRAWLAAIEETDLAIIGEVLAKCRQDSDALRYFVGRAKQEPPETAPFDHEAFEERAAIVEHDGGLSRDEAEAIAWIEDDRRRCVHCLNLRDGGICKVAIPGGPVSARRGYQPDPAILQRCAGYRPVQDDPDQRTGRERWPEFQ
jgi:hypothetical protein